MEKFLDLFNEMLDCDKMVDSNSILAEIEEWDSLSYVAFTAMIDCEYGKQVKAIDVKTAIVVSDLYKLACGE